MTLDNLCELNEKDCIDIINSLSMNETKKLLIEAIRDRKKNQKLIQQRNRLVKEKYSTSSENVKIKDDTSLNYEGKNKNENKKRGRKTGDKNTYNEIAQRIINGEGKDGLIDGIPYEEVILESDDKCPVCNSDLVEIDEDTMVKVVYIPGSYKLVLFRKKKKVCKNHDCEEMYVPYINDPLKKTHISVSLISQIIKSKYQFGVPPYRLLDELKNNHIHISYNQLIHHMMNVGLKLAPLSNRIEKIAFENNSAIHIDETYFKLLKSEKKSDGTERIKNYIFALVTDKIQYYKFTGSRDVEWLKELFEDMDYMGWVTTDDYPGYNFLDKNDNVKHQLCMCHARRKMYYAYEAAPKEIRETDNCMSRKGLLLFKAIFDEEKKIKNESPQYIKEYRNSDNYKAKINDLKIFCTTTNAVSGTLLDEALMYINSNWDHLWTYLEDGSIPFTNMKAELGIKKVALVRKNSLFFKNKESAEINCHLLTIVQTAVKNNLDVYRYLNYVIHHIETADVDSLLPWNENLYSLGENYII